MTGASSFSNSSSEASWSILKHLEASCTIPVRYPRANIPCQLRLYGVQYNVHCRQAAASQDGEAWKVKRMVIHAPLWVYKDDPQRFFTTMTTTHNNYASHMLLRRRAPGIPQDLQSMIRQCPCGLRVSQTLPARRVFRWKRRDKAGIDPIDKDMKKLFVRSPLMKIAEVLTYADDCEASFVWLLWITFHQGFNDHPMFSSHSSGCVMVCFCHVS